MTSRDVFGPLRCQEFINVSMKITKVIIEVFIIVKGKKLRHLVQSFFRKICLGKIPIRKNTRSLPKKGTTKNGCCSVKEIKNMAWHFAWKKSLRFKWLISFSLINTLWQCCKKCCKTTFHWKWQWCRLWVSTNTNPIAAATECLPINPAIHHYSSWNARCLFGGKMGRQNNSALTLLQSHVTLYIEEDEKMTVFLNNFLFHSPHECVVQ